MDKNRGYELAQQLTDYVNSFSQKELRQDFIKGFVRQHPTLQQSAFGMLLELMEYMASEEYIPDGRNEDSKKVAKRLVNGFHHEYEKVLREQGVSEDRIREYSKSEHYLPSKFLSFI